MAHEHHGHHHKRERDVAGALVTGYVALNALAWGYLGLTLITQGPSEALITESIGFGVLDIVAPIAMATIANRVASRQRRSR